MELRAPSGWSTGTRLMRARESYGFRVVALSAVAARAAPALARWISAAPDAEPTTSSYRSTRQMLGRLEVSAAGQYTIRYDLMDGRSLRFDDERRGETPYVRNPFPPLPAPIDAALGPEVRMRAPTLWAALQLAAQRPDELDTFSTYFVSSRRGCICLNLCGSHGCLAAGLSAEFRIG